MTIRASDTTPGDSIHPRRREAPTREARHPCPSEYSGIPTRADRPSGRSQAPPAAEHPRARGLTDDPPRDDLHDGLAREDCRSCRRFTILDRRLPDGRTAARRAGEAHVLPRFCPGKMLPPRGAPASPRRAGTGYGNRTEHTSVFCLLSSVDARGPFFGFRWRGSRHPPSPCASRVGPRKCDRRRGREARRRARRPTFTVTRRMTCATGHGACQGAAAPIAHPPARPIPSPRAWSLHHGSAIAAHLDSRRPARVVACPDAGTVRRPAFRRRARAGLAGFRRAVAGHGQPASAARSLQVVAVSRCRRRAVR